MENAKGRLKSYKQANTNKKYERGKRKKRKQPTHI